jgi:hypothetical protein
MNEWRNFFLSDDIIIWKKWCRLLCSIKNIIWHEVLKCDLTGEKDQETPMMKHEFKVQNMGI